jgi:flagellar biosynthesis/type III secretory pathway protein FliH
MLLSEWDQDEALAVRYEEGREEGFDMGLSKGIKKGREEILDFIRKGYNLTDIEKLLRG